MLNTYLAQPRYSPLLLRKKTEIIKTPVKKTVKKKNKLYTDFEQLTLT